MVQCYEFNYTSNQPQPLSNVWIPCPVGDNCCIGTDLCLSNNICHFAGSSKEKREASYSSYYNARCTDPTYTNPACDKICVDSPPDIVYNYTSSLWACCGNNTAGEVTCNNPSSEYYEAPAPDDLVTLSSGAAVATTATLTPYSQISSKATISSNSNATTTTASASSIGSTTALADRNSDGVSTGAAAGIGVAVAIIAIALLAAFLFWFRRKKARRAHQSNLSKENRGIVELPGYGHDRQELDTNQSGRLLELSDDSVPSNSGRQSFQRQRSELPGST